MKTIICVVNRIKIVQVNQKFFCVSPDKKTLEEFSNLNEAKDWCKNTFDFLKRA